MELLNDTKGLLEESFCLHNLLLCFLFFLTGCSASPTVLTYTPSGTIPLSLSPQGKTILVIGFENAMTDKQDDPTMMGKYGAGIVDVHGVEAVAQTVTSAVANELRSQGFYVETLGPQTGVPKEAISYELSGFQPREGNPVVGVIWGKIHRFYYYGGTWATAKVDIEFDSISKDGQTVYYSKKLPCSKSAAALNVGATLLINSVLPPYIPLGPALMFSEPNQAARLLNTCLQETVQAALTDEELIKTLQKP